MGGRLSLDALARSPRFQLLAAADLRPEVRAELEALYPGLKVYASHREMLEERPTEVVCVSSYPPSHEEVTLDALRLPLRAILVEKPLGHTAASGRRILQAVRERGIPLAVPHNLLARRVSLEIVERVRNGEIGVLKLVQIECRGWDIINAGIHWLQFFVTLTGGEALDGVMALCDAATRTWRDGMQVETRAVTCATTKSGVRVVMETGDETPVSRDGKQFLFRLIGDQGQLEFWGWDPSYRLLNTTYPHGQEFTPEEFQVSGHRRHLERMADEADRSEPDYTLAENSLKALELCEGAYLSSQLGCRVTFPLEAFSPPVKTDWRPGQPYSGEGGGRDGRQFG